MSEADIDWYYKNVTSKICHMPRGYGRDRHVVYDKRDVLEILDESGPITLAKLWNKFILEKKNGKTGNDAEFK